MSRTDKFTAHGAFYRAEARADGERWMIAVYRNGSLATVTEYRGPPHSLNDRALAFAFEAVRDLADQGWLVFDRMHVDRLVASCPLRDEALAFAALMNRDPVRPAMAARREIRMGSQY